MESSGLVLSIKATIESISAKYNTIETIRDLPKAFNVVKEYLPLVLESTSWDGRNSGYEDSQLLSAILEKAAKLERVLDEIKNKYKNENGGKS